MAIIDTELTMGSPTSIFYVRKQGQRMKPFDKANLVPLSYALEVKFNRGGDMGPFGRPCGGSYWGEVVPQHICTSLFGNTNLWFTAEGDIAYANAYRRWKDLAYTQASNMTALMERRKTYDMIVKRLQQLYKGAGELRRGRFRDFLKTFGLTAKNKHKHTKWSRPADFGKLWLEYWMGWAPTVGDINNSVKALTGRIPDDTIRAGSTVPLSKYNTQTYNSARADSSYTGEGTVYISGQIEVVNPMLHLAQTVGLINWPKSVWETIGFSWLVDWFTNIGQVLGQFTDWVGLRLKNLCVSCKTVAQSGWVCINAPSVFGAGYPQTMYRNVEYAWFTRHRVYSLPTIKPIARLPDGLSVTRGATLCSLLLTMFAPLKKK